MYSHVSLKVMLVLKHPRADVTLERLDVTNIMKCGKVLFQVAFLGKLPAANLALVLGVRVFGFTAASLSMRRVVVNADS